MYLDTVVVSLGLLHEEGTHADDGPQQEHSHECHETAFKPLFAIFKGEAEVDDIPEEVGLSEYLVANLSACGGVYGYRRSQDGEECAKGKVADDIVAVDAHEGGYALKGSQTSKCSKRENKP